MTNITANEKTATKNAVIIPFNEYTVHYYSQSNAEWEAALIHCFQTNEKVKNRHAGTLVFVYPDGTTPPGLENPIPANYPTRNRAAQKNELMTNDFFRMYFTLDRFDHVINQLRYAFDSNTKNGKGDDASMFVSADPYGHVWALCNNTHVQVGAQYNL